MRLLKKFKKKIFHVFILLYTIFVFKLRVNLLAAVAVRSLKTELKLNEVFKKKLKKKIQQS
jgi:hypothetical protein